MKRILLAMLFVTTFSLTSKAVDVDGMFGYSFAEEFDRDNSDIESEGAFVLGVRLKNEINRGFGWNAGLSLDTIREFDNSSGELGFFLLEGNGTLAIDQIKALYVFAGLNYPMIVYEDKNVNDVDPVFGVQFGTGFNLSPEAGIELAYRAVNFEFGSTDANLWGFSFRGFYTFAGF